MLSICRLVPLGHGHGDLQQMERYREIDFPIEGPSQATDWQKDILAEALKTLFLEDHDSSSGAQIVLISPCGRILAFENVERRGEPNSFTWGDVLLVVPPEGLPELPTFMCEQQTSCGSQMNSDCFEITDSLGRSWIAYQVRAGLENWSEFPETDGIQICQREDLANRLGRV
jgi:hypothetical protein